MFHTKGTACRCAFSPSWHPVGSQCSWLPSSSKVPLRTPSDLGGVKLRTQQTLPEQVFGDVQSVYLLTGSENLGSGSPRRKAKSRGVVHDETGCITGVGANTCSVHVSFFGQLSSSESCSWQLQAYRGSQVLVEVGASIPGSPCLVVCTQPAVPLLL